MNLSKFMNKGIIQRINIMANTKKHKKRKIDWQKVIDQGTGFFVIPIYDDGLVRSSAWSK